MSEVAIDQESRSRHAPILASRSLEWLAQCAAFSGIIVTLLVAVVFAPAFFNSANLRAVLIQTAILGIVVAGQTTTLLARGIDMSVSAVMTFAAVFASSAAMGADMAFLLVQLAALVTIVGLANGLLITWRRVPPFVATFAMLIVIDGARLAYTRGQTATSAPHWLASIGGGAILGVPVPVIAWLVLLVAAFIGLALTPWGRWLYALGSNRDAARFAGVPVNAVTMSTFIISALAAVLAGILQAGYIGYIDNTLGANYSLNSIAAAIIGGVSFSGGRGGVIGSAIGALLLTILMNLLVVMGMELFWQQIVQGAVLLLAVVVQGLRSRSQQT